MKKNDYNNNENDEHSSIHQSLNEDRDQQDTLLEKYKNEGAYRRSNLRSNRFIAGKGVEKLKMTFKGDTLSFYHEKTVTNVKK